MRRGYADTEAGQIHYRRMGSGDPLLLLHNTTHSSAMFTELIAVLAGDFTCIAPDYPGFGNSDPLPDGATFPGVAEVLLEVIETLGFESTHVFGLHTGNKLGAAMAARTPSRVDRFVLCGAPHSIIPDDERRNAVIRARVSDSLRTYGADSAEAGALKEWADLFHRVTDRWWDPAVLGRRPVDAEHLDRVATSIIEILQMRHSLEAMYAANFAYPWGEVLPDVAVPTLILELGHPDEIEAHGLQGDRLTDRIPSSVWRVVDDADVGTIYESPASIAEPVLDFLDA